MKTTLVIMAAGIGSRFGGGIKQLAAVGPNGEIIMDFSIHDAIEAGFNKIVFIIRHDIADAFRAAIGDRIERICAELGVEIAYAYQELDALPAGVALPAGRTKPWGTGQAVLACKGILDTPFAVINADDYYGKEAFVQLHTFLQGYDAAKPGALCMAGFVLKNTLSDNGAVTRGICRMNEEAYLTGVDETSGITKTADGGAEAGGQAIDPESLVSMNMWGLTPEFVGLLEDGFREFFAKMDGNALKAEYLLPIYIDELLKAGRGDQLEADARDGAVVWGDGEVRVDPQDAVAAQRVGDHPADAGAVRPAAGERQLHTGQAAAGEADGRAEGKRFAPDAGVLLLPAPGGLGVEAGERAVKAGGRLPEEDGLAVLPQAPGASRPRVEDEARPGGLEHQLAVLLRGGDRAERRGGLQSSRGAAPERELEQADLLPGLRIERCLPPAHGELDRVQAAGLLLMRDGTGELARLARPQQRELHRAARRDHAILAQGGLAAVGRRRLREAVVAQEEAIPIGDGEPGGIAPEAGHAHWRVGLLHLAGDRLPPQIRQDNAVAGHERRAVSPEVPKHAVKENQREKKR